MPGTRCAVTGCGNQREQTKKIAGQEHIKYHTFPSNEKVRQQWVERCWPAESSCDPYGKRVCSEHFKEEDIERDLKAELLQLPPTRRLKKTAVPSLKLPPNRGQALSGAATTTNGRVRKQDLKRLATAFRREPPNPDESAVPEQGEDPMVLASTLSLSELIQKFSSKRKRSLEAASRLADVTGMEELAKAGSPSTSSEPNEQPATATLASTGRKRAKTKAPSKVCASTLHDPATTNPSASLPPNDLLVIVPPNGNLSGRSLCCWLEAERSRLLEEENEQLKKTVAELRSQETLQHDRMSELQETNRQLKEVLFNVKGARANRSTGPQVQTVKLEDPNVVLVVVDI